MLVDRQVSLVGWRIRSAIFMDARTASPRPLAILAAFWWARRSHLMRTTLAHVVTLQGPHTAIATWRCPACCGQGKLDRICVQLINRRSQAFVSLRFNGVIKCTQTISGTYQRRISH